MTNLTAKKRNDALLYNEPMHNIQIQDTKLSILVDYADSVIKDLDSPCALSASICINPFFYKLNIV